jgi:hypothetical protein
LQREYCTGGYIYKAVFMMSGSMRLLEVTLVIVSILLVFNIDDNAARRGIEAVKI